MRAQLVPRVIASLLPALLLGVPACGEDAAAPVTNPDFSVGPHGEFVEFASNRVVLPNKDKDPGNYYAIDLNGDGKADNQLGLIVSLLDGQMLDIQFPVDVTFQQGDAVALWTLQTIDPALKNDSVATLGYYLGKPFGGMIERTDYGAYVLDGGCAMCPDFTGSGQFMVDTDVRPAQLIGTLKNGHFASDNPVTTRNPATITMRLSLGAGQPPADFIINGAHFEFDTGIDKTYNQPALLNGRIAGSVKNEDVQKHIVPAIATLLTEDVKKYPNSGSTAQIRMLFDKGGCTNPDGTTAKAGDDKIDVCEVASSGLIKVVLAPDVAIYDKNGN